MEFTAQQLAELLKGKIEGNPEVKVNKVSKIEEAQKGSLSFIANPKYAQYLDKTNASVIILNRSFKPDKKVHPTLIIVNDAYTAFAKILEKYNEIKYDKRGISDKASISDSARIGKEVYIGDFVSIGDNVVISDHAKIYPNSYIGDNVVIGNKTTLFAGVLIYPDNEIGNNCTIHAGVVIGSDGFGFAPQSDSNYKKVAQTGNVIIEDKVEIGSNTTIDRATLGSTIIKKGVKLDNLIQIAHNVEIGENTVIAAQTGISGSTKIGRNCMIGGQVGITGHLSIADEVKIGAQSGISSDITKKGAVVLGSPAFAINKYRKAYVHFRNLDEVIKRLERLERQER